jgi:fermentation-respiration switch protein FrsA (DUF1100 family)
MRSFAAAAGIIALALVGCAPRLSETIPLRLVRQEPARADSLEEVHDLLFLSPSGDSVGATLRRPTVARRKGGGLPGIVLLAGRETGRQAAAVVPGPIEALILAVEYPEVIPESARPGEMLRRLPGIRRSAYRVPGLLRGVAHFLASQPEIDPSRIALVGVSFGVPFAAAAAIDPIFCCVALHHGGADLALLFRSNLAIPNPVVRRVASAFAARYFRQLEPERYVGEVAPRPLLLINGLHDEMVPRRSALRLGESAGPPVRQIWLPHDHLMPEDLEVMRELADSTLRHFPQLR